MQLNGIDRTIFQVFLSFGLFSKRPDLVGMILYFIPELDWQYQLLIFALFSVAAIFAARAILQRHPIQTDQPNLNRRGEQYVGRVFTLEEAIINGEGKIHVDDSIWKVRGADCPTGNKVKVTGVDGVVLLVQLDR